jgi:hypothetical protein
MPGFVLLGSSVGTAVTSNTVAQPKHVQINKSWKDALTKLNEHLTFSDLWCRSVRVTLADIRLIVSLYGCQCGSVVQDVSTADQKKPVISCVGTKPAHQKNGSPPVSRLWQRRFQLRARWRTASSSAASIQFE